MNSLEVGKKYPGNYKQEGIKLDYNGGFSLHILLPGLTDEETKDIQQGSYRFGLIEKEDILFFVSEFGESINLSDAPFHFGLYTDNRAKEIPESIEDGQGVALNVIAVDSTTGIVKALRLIGLSTEFSKELIRISKKQSHRRVESNQYNKKLMRLQNAFSSEDLYNESSIRCSGGR